jgi:O-antigen ligase
MQDFRAKLGWLWLNLERLIIVLFFFSFTLNIRKVFLTPYSFLNGGFNEYLTPSFTWSDLLIISVIFIYIIKYIFCQFRPYYGFITVLKYNIYYLSNSSIRNISRGTFFFLLFLTWAGLSVFWSSFPLITWYRFAILIELSLFSLIVYRLFHKKHWIQFLIMAIIANGLIQSFIAIAQFISNSSIGFHILGESILGPNIDGVAKIFINGMKHIRAYGTLPHPNILAGFLVIPLFLVANFIKKGHRLSLLTENGEPTVTHETLLDRFPLWLCWLVGTILAFGFTSTVSRSAFLAIFLTLLFSTMFHCFRFGDKRFDLLVNMKQLKCFSSSQLFIALTAGIALLSLATFLALTCTSINSDQSLIERRQYSNVSYETIFEHPIRGIGLGQFVFNEYAKYPNLDSWQYQPVHNLYLLIFSELGIVGVSLAFVSLLYFLLSFQGRRGNSVAHLTYYCFYIIVLCFSIISFFDHYFWDIKLGNIIFTMPFMFIGLFSNFKAD